MLTCTYVQHPSLVFMQQQHEACAIIALTNAKVAGCRKDSTPWFAQTNQCPMKHGHKHQLLSFLAAQSPVGTEPPAILTADACVYASCDAGSFAPGDQSCSLVSFTQQLLLEKSDSPQMNTPVSGCCTSQTHINNDYTNGSEPSTKLVEQQVERLFTSAALCLLFDSVSIMHDKVNF
jgi:hypothetical protein